MLAVLDSCKLAKIMPWSSSGRNDVGVSLKPPAKRTMTPAVTATVTGNLAEKKPTAPRYFSFILSIMSSNHLKNPRGLSSSSPFKKIAHNDGLSVSALKAEKIIAVAIVTANCW